MMHRHTANRRMVLWPLQAVVFFQCAFLSLAYGQVKAPSSRAVEDRRPHLVMIIAEDEYETERTLPGFARAYLDKDFKVSYVFGDVRQRDRLPGLEVLKEADVALLSVRRWPLPPGQLDEVRRFIGTGKPLVALRTSSHAFALRKNQTLQKGLAEWPEFDAEVLGGNYHGHYSNKSDEAPTRVWIVPEAKDHPVMRGLPKGEITMPSWLYKTRPLGEKATPLMWGRAVEQEPPEPVSWTHTGPGGGRVFYTSLGHPGDFEVPMFKRLLLNGIYWAAGLEVPLRRDL